MKVIHRRRFLKALGLGGLVSAYGSLPGSRRARAEPETTPRRVVFLVSSHGHVWKNWHMPVPGASERATTSFDLTSRTEGLSPTLQPLQGMRHKLTAIEGLAHTTMLGEFVQQTEGSGTDANNHTISYAGLLTHQYAFQPGGGAMCRGGGPSIDQLIASRLPAETVLNSLTWDTEQDLGKRYQREYSYVEAGVPTPFESNPAAAYADLFGLRMPPGGSREARIDIAAIDAINAATEAYSRVLPTLGTEGRRKLEQHRDLLSELASARSRESGVCGLSFESRGHVTEQFLRLAELALSCDMTRVITLAMPILDPQDFGYDAGIELHGELAHASIEGGTTAFSPFAEQAMTDYNRWYATRVGAFLERLDAIPEGDGTVLDHTAVVWLSELGTPTHEHRDVCTVLAGATRFFDQGRYVRFPRDTLAPSGWRVGRSFADGSPAMIGPSTGKLFVSLLRWMGFDEDSFGLTTVRRQDGSEIDVSGALDELHA